MTDKPTSVRSDIARAMAKTAKPKTAIPNGGQRDTLGYFAAPRAKFRPQPFVQPSPVGNGLGYGAGESVRRVK